MEKSLKFSGIVRVSSDGIVLMGSGNDGISLHGAVREMLGFDTDAYEDVPCELVITANRYDDCFEINGEKFEVSKGE